MNRTSLHHLLSHQKSSCKLIATILISCLSTVSVTAQRNFQLNGHWQLQKVSYNKMVANTTENNKDQFLGIFKAALHNKQSTFEDLEWVNTEAEILRDAYYLTTIEFQANGAFYNTSLNKEKSLSGEYVLDKKKLLLDWETGDKTNLKILKNTTSEFVLKDNNLKIIYYYIKVDQKKVDELSARLKKEKELECTKPDKDRIEAEKAAIEKMKSK